MGFNLDTSIPAITVFLQGLLSFLSPCVLPLVPLYISYLAGGAKTKMPDGTVKYKRGTVMLNTFFFVLGISFTFFVLGLGVTAVGQFFNEYRSIFAKIGGAVIVLFGLIQLGVFGKESVSREHRLPFRLDKLAMNPLTALLMGFLFSFAWTPCVGPALTSVLIMASSAKTAFYGFLLIGVYTLGFVLPFLAVGFFTGSMLNFLRSHRNFMKYTVKIGGIIMIFMGVMMITGWLNGITGYLSGLGGGPSASVSSEAVPPSSSSEAVLPDASESDSSENESSEAESREPDPDAIPAPDFTLLDQNGNEVTLSDFKGKVVFLNFWATWCGPCRREMPDIQKLYEKYGENSEDLVILGIANPKSEENPRTSEGTVEEVTKFLSDGGYTYPVVMDTTGEIFAQYGISAFPTTFMIDAEGNVFGYITGSLTMDMMESIIQQTKDGVRN